MATAAVSPEPEPASEPGSSLVESYRRLAEVFHDVLSEQSRDALLDRVADTLGDLVPYDSLIIYEADEAGRELVPVVARDEYAEEIFQTRCYFGEGISGWAVQYRTPVLTNQAHLDPRVKVIPGTPPDEPEALITVPLIARDHVKGALNIYRHGVDASFEDEEFEVARRFADAAALAIDNAEIRARLELQAQTDPLTGLYNHRFFHERLRAELTRASRARDAVALLMFDIDDFKRVNDICGHAVGDQILIALAEAARTLVRASDVVCRIGGEEFAVIMPSCDAGDALGLARRLVERLETRPIDAAGEITVSIGIAQGPEHAMNPRELVACAEAAMMTAKARGKSRIVVYDGTSSERPDQPAGGRDTRSIAHLKMLQSVAGRLNRLNDVREIGEAIVSELRMLIDYHSCRLYVRNHEDLLVPVACGGEIVDHEGQPVMPPSLRLGEGVTGRVAETGRPLLVPNALECEFVMQIPGTPPIEESLIAVPLRYESRSIGVVFLSKLGVGQFDENDLRLLEVLAGHAAVALENARLYETVLREAANANALLEFSDAMSSADSFEEIAESAVAIVARLMGLEECSLWLEEQATGEFRCAAQIGYDGESPTARTVESEIGRAIAARTDPFVMTSDELRSEFWGGNGELDLHAAVLAPLRPGHGVRGWLTARTRADDVQHFTDDRLRLLEGLSYRASMALQKALLDRDQRESAEIANALLASARELATAEGVEDVLSRIVASAAGQLGAPRAYVLLEDPDAGVVRVETAFGAETGAEFPSKHVRELLDADAPRVVSREEMQRVPGAENATVPVAAAPLHLPGGRLGSLVVAAPAEDHVFPDWHLRVLSGIAHQATLALSR